MKDIESVEVDEGFWSDPSVKYVVLKYYCGKKSIRASGTFTCYKRDRVDHTSPSQGTQATVRILVGDKDLAERIAIAFNHSIKLAGGGKKCKNDLF